MQHPKGSAPSSARFWQRGLLSQPARTGCCRGQSTGGGVHVNAYLSLNLAVGKVRSDMSSALESEGPGQMNRMH
eukprot:2126560-Pyramimonas_sp.AAC.1